MVDILTKFKLLNIADRKTFDIFINLNQNLEDFKDDSPGNITMQIATFARYLNESFSTFGIEAIASFVELLTNIPIR